MREDWIETEIINVLDTLPNGKKMNQGWSPQCKNYPSSSNEIWGVLKTTAIQPNQFWDHENKELPPEKEIKPHLEVNKGDILVTCAGPRNRCGVVCTVRETRPRLLLSGKMYRFRPNNKVILTDFLSYLLQTHESWLAIDAMKTGTSESGLNLTHARFKKLKTFIAPLPEQRAIVAKIEELFSELNKGEEDLKQAQEQLKVYRQAVLKKAFEGELTKEWRDQQTDLPTADELLEQIKEERQKNYEEQKEKWQHAVKDWEASGKEGKRPTLPKKIKEFVKLTAQESSELPKLPRSWTWEKFGNICLKIMDGTHFSPRNLGEGDYKYISAKNIKEGWIDLSNISFVTEEDHKEIYSRCDVKKGDILYIKDGATTGRAAVNYIDEEFSLLSSVGVFRTKHSLIIPEFMQYYLNAQIVRNRMLSNVAGVAITRLTLIKLNNALFVICSPEEQKQIVREIESRLSLCDSIEASIRESLDKSKALRQSILKKAFEGTLLSEEEISACKAAPDYEPASVLLERIKAEKKKK